MSKNIIFIDSRVQNLSSLTSELPADAVAVVLDAAEEGLSQIARALAGHTDLEAIHVISHGAAGSLLLGSTTLSADNLAAYHDQLQRIGDSLVDGGDLLLYGCNVAQGAAGQSFVDSLALLTGADVAASTDISGGGASGGNAVLEFATGRIATAALSLGQIGSLDSQVGTPGDDVLDGTAGADTLTGGLGNDTYVVNHQDDVVVEHANEGNDVIQLAVAGSGALSYAMPDNVEDVVVAVDGSIAVTVLGNELANTITGDAAANALLGGAGDDTLIGGEGSDTLTGGTGKDSMVGGAGNESYYIDDVGDVAIELMSGGIDRVYTTLAAYTLGDNLEHVKFIGQGSFHGTGNDWANTMQIGDGGGTLDGGAGSDRLEGGTGSDTLLGGTGNDIIINGGGNDSIDGGAGNDDITVYSGNATVDGGAGNGDLLRFDGAFSDYKVTHPNATDIVLVHRDGGVYTVRNVETFFFDGDMLNLAQVLENAASTGNDSLHGTDGNDTMDGFQGIDTLAGGLGDDTYVIANAASVVVENADEGTDLIQVALTAAGTYKLQANVENATVTAGASIAVGLTGNELNNKLIGNAAANTLTGGAGDDTLDGGAGADKLIGGAGDDAYIVDVSGDTVTELANEGTDTVRTSLAAYTLGVNLENLSYTGSAAFAGSGNALNNVIVGGIGNDSLQGGAGNDVIDTGGNGKDTIDGGADSDVLQGLGNFGGYTITRPTATDTVLTDADGTTVTVRNIESFVFADGVRTLAQVHDNVGSPGNDVLHGTGYDDTINGGTGIDTMDGGIGSDTYVIANAASVVLENADEGIDLIQVALTSAGTYALSANVENATVTAAATIAVNLTGNALDNVLTGNGAANALAGGAGNDVLDGGAGADRLAGGLGHDTYVVDAAGDVVTELANEGTDTVKTALAGYTLGVNVENLVYTGTAAFSGSGNALDNNISGGIGNDSLQGGAGYDVFTAGGGKDTIDGGADGDILQGLGNFDSYTITRPTLTDTVLTDAGGNVITVRNIESFIFADGTRGLVGVQDNIASPGNDFLFGTAGNDTVNGGLGIDTMAGGAGDDTYVVANAASIVQESADEGTDLVQVALTAAGTYALTGNVENATVTAAASVALNLTGNALDNRLTGNAAANTLIGGAGNDTLDGGAGSDKLTGGTGDDTYVVDAAGDVVTELLNEGTDIVKTALATYTLGANLENLSYTGVASFTGTGNALDNVIIGGVGADSLQGGLGNDTLTGGGGKDTIDGGAGADSLLGLDDFSAYTVTCPNANDTVLTHGDGTVVTVRGIETFYFNGVAMTLAALQDNIATIGNDSLHGGPSYDLLDGGPGADTMVGGAGHDTYRVDNVLDVIVENADEGTDFVEVALASAGTYTLSDNLEIATVVGAASVAVNLTGNALDNGLTGNAAANTLIGGAGNDVLLGLGGNDKLIGGSGDDQYFVEDAGDVVTELAGEGSDMVFVKLASYTLGDNLEVLVYDGAGLFTGTGNALDNLIDGGDGGNKIDGGAGNDSLYGGNGADSLQGGTGDDFLEVSNGKDTIDGGDGNDVLTGLNSLATYTITRASETDTVLTDAAGNVTTVRNVESFAFAGETRSLDELLDNRATPYSDKLHGTAGADTINGGSGVDTMDGGAGDDTYVVANVNSVVLENADQGSDLVQVALTAAATYVLAANVENATVTAAASVAANITGNALDNKLTGNAAANTLAGGIGSDTLDGGAGADKLAGGVGDDVYVVDVAGDVVTESLNEGTDSVQTTLASYTLAANVENLYYTGSANFTGIGNALDNVILGGAGNDSLQGGGGDDSLYAGKGKDTIDGGADADLVTLDGAFASFTITRPTATDTVFTDAAGNATTVRYVEMFYFSDGGKSLAEVQGNIASAFNDNLRGTSGSDTLNGGAGIDTLTGGGGDDTYVIANVNSKVVESAGEGTDWVQVALTAAATYVLADNVENAAVTAAASVAVNLTGNDLNNYMTGNAAANKLIGGAGDDDLDGGAGNDTMTGGTGSDIYVVSDAGDVVVELAGEGMDVVLTTLSSYTLAANVEVLSYAGKSAFTGTGNGLDNILYGAEAAGAKLDGGAGDDTLYASIGSDSLVGGLGDDAIYGGGGKDTIDGGAGGDTVYLDGLRSDYTVSRPNATDTVFTNAAGDVTTVRNAEAFVFAGDDAVTLTLAEVQNNVGSIGNDSLHGTSGDDTLDGGAGTDTLAGGAGDDTYVITSVNSSVQENADEGNDLARVALTAAGTYTLADNIENATAAAAASIAVNLTGNALDNELTGNAAANKLVGGAGNDSLDGGAGNDTLAGGTGNDVYRVDAAGDVVTEAAGAGSDAVETTLATYVLGANLEGLGYMGTAAFTGTGNALDNTMYANNAAGAKLDGGAGNDMLTGSAGNDSLLGGLGDDSIVAHGGKDTIDGGAGDDDVSLAGTFESYQVTRPNAADTVLTDADGNVITMRNVEILYFNGVGYTMAQVQDGIASAGDDHLHGTAGNDTINGGTGVDTMDGGLGNDTYVIANVNSLVVENAGEGSDLVQVALTAAGTYALADNVENATVTAAVAIAVNLTGNDLNNKLTGNAAANKLIGGAGDDTLDGGAGSDLMQGGAGDDTYIVTDAGDVVMETGLDIDTVNTTLSTYTLPENIEVLRYTGKGAFTGIGSENGEFIYGGEGGAKLDGRGGDDVLIGGAGNDSLLGGNGNDILSITAGKDTLDGGAGDDSIDVPGYFTDFKFTRPNATEIVMTDAAGNVTTVRNAETFWFLDGVKSLADMYAAVASAGNDSLIGTDGNDTINGGAGVDTMAGGLGDDTYVVDNPLDVIGEGADAGSDLVQVALAAAGTYTLAANVEKATVTAAASVAVNLTGNALDNQLTGNAAVNTLIGGAGNDTLDGGAGADKLSGGAGNDTYVVDVAGDAVTELAGEGSDSVVISGALATYVLGANVENLSASGTVLFTGTGNALDNLIAATGTGGARLDGGAGNDTLQGGIGNDSLQGGDGDDTFRHLTSGADTIDGGAGSDTLDAGAALGNYLVVRVNATDVQLVGGNGSITTVRNVEHFHFTDVDVTLAELTAGTVSVGSDTVNGGNGNDLLDGGVGADKLIGGQGHDTYVLSETGDQVVELADEGIDTVQLAFTASATYVMAANVENAVVTAAVAVHVTGNELDNAITGNAAANKLIGGAGSDTLDGGLGNDTLTGGAGDDLYVVRDAGDVVVELASEGIDRVDTALASYTLTANVEKLYYTGSTVFSGIGNALDNDIRAIDAASVVIDGGAGNDVIYGGYESNTLQGGLGDDAFIMLYSNLRGSIDGGAGNDAVNLGLALSDYTVTYANGVTTLSYFEYALSLKNVESVSFSDGTRSIAQVLHGVVTEGNDELSGTSGDDVLNGGLGTDTLAGGGGDDIYVIDSVGDSVLENALEGHDLIRVGFAAAGVYALTDNVEDATVTSTAAINLTGNLLDNVLTGNAAANILLGGAGNDTLSGGAGNDSLVGGNGQDYLDGGAGSDTLQGGDGNNSYVVDAAGDKIVDGFANDVDQVLTSLASYTLAADLNNLKYTGAAAFTGTGNAVANLIEGGAGNDVLKGLAGNDTLIGGAGNDQLTGGADADVFVLTSLSGSDTVADFLSGTDLLKVLLPVGNGDSAIDGGLVRASANGFTTDAELVLFTQKMATATTANAAAAIGSATGNYEVGDTALFAVSTAGATVLYRFQAANADAVVSAGELTQLVTLTGTPTTALADYALADYLG